MYKGDKDAFARNRSRSVYDVVNLSFKPSSARDLAPMSLSYCLRDGCGVSAIKAASGTLFEIGTGVTDICKASPNEE